MIETIYLHIGLHKTGTSTVQESFGEIRPYLAQHGFLYPAFKMNDFNTFNHTIPIVSMFCSKPEKYRINIRNGFTTKEAVEELNQRYDRQLKEQIRNFGGHTLIISGEGISLLSSDELFELRKYLIGLTNPQVTFRILMVIRHPVGWSVSRFQEIVKSGYPLQSFMPKASTSKAHPYSIVLEKLKITFPPDSIFIQRYEDLSANTNGLFAGFIRSFQIFNKEIELVENKRINQSITYEGITILSAIYENFPFFENPDLEPIFRKFNHFFIINIPGVRFQISEKQCQAIWDKYHQVVNKLCIQYNLPEYSYRCNYENNDKEKWGNAVTDYLTGIIQKLPEEIIPVVLMELLSEIKKYRKHWPLEKRYRIFKLVMYYSKYFQTDSMMRKTQIIISKAGFLNGMVLLPRYYLMNKLKKH